MKGYYGQNKVVPGTMIISALLIICSYKAAEMNDSRGPFSEQMSQGKRQNSEENLAWRSLVEYADGK
jgi:hypothetical protein